RSASASHVAGAEVAVDHQIATVVQLTGQVVGHDVLAGVQRRHIRRLRHGTRGPHRVQLQRLTMQPSPALFQAIAMARTPTNIVSVVFLVLGCGLAETAGIAQDKPRFTAPAPVFLVERVVDGDTLVVRLDNQSVKVRLIGVDASESVVPGSWSSGSPGS